MPRNARPAGPENGPPASPKTGPTRSRKPATPRLTVPIDGVLHSLGRHSTGQWMKKHAGRRYFFGTDPELAARAFATDWPAILDGRPRPSRMTGRATLAQAGGHVRTATLLAAAAEAVRGLQIGLAHRRKIAWTGAFLLDHLPPTLALPTASPDEIAATRQAFAALVTRHMTGRGAQRQRDIIVTTRRLLVLGADRLGLPMPPDTGRGFRPPPARTARLQARDEPGYTPEQARRLAATLPTGLVTKRRETDEAVTAACILLGLNAGCLASEIAALRPADMRTARVKIDGDTQRRALIDARRPKIGRPRRFCLWPETAAAITAARVCLASQNAPNLDTILLPTRAGTALVHGTTDQIGKRFARLAGPVGGSFSWLRKTYRAACFDASTGPFARGIGEPGPVRRLTMGHGGGDVHDGYLRRIPDDAVANLAEHARRWLWP